MKQTIAIERVDHIGIRVCNLDRALQFYRILGFNLLHRAKCDDVAIIRNGSSVELNLIFNANAGEPNTNVLMDVPEKYAGYTHMALRVASIPDIGSPLKRPEPERNSRTLARHCRSYNGAAWKPGDANAYLCSTMWVSPCGRHARARQKRYRLEASQGSNRLVEGKDVLSELRGVD